MNLEYILLIGPILFWFVISKREYGEFLFTEIRAHKIQFIFGATLLLAHFILLVVMGKSWFCGESIRNKGIISSFLFPGLGYAFITFPFAVSGSAFHSSRERIMETSTTLAGIFFIIYGYIQILIYRISQIS